MMKHNHSPISSVLDRYVPSYEYRSKSNFFGLPLVHITRGIDPETGRFRVARGIFALGDIAVGGVAVGGITFGGLTLGGISIGTLAAGGIALGVFSVGGISIGAAAAVGAIAVSLQTAIGILTGIPNLDNARGLISNSVAMLAGWASNIRI